jgi:3-hydroxybutyryl-CoA dehydrogenase
VTYDAHEPPEEAQPVDRLATIGAGTMGRDIAFAAAAGGCQVRLFDVDNASLQAAHERIRTVAAALEGTDAYEFDDAEAVADRVEYTTSIETAVADVDLVIEAVPEVRETKLATFERIDRHAPEHAIVATNTSSLPLDELAEPIDTPERFCGMHWFHPPHIVPVVEVVFGEQTATETIESAARFLETIGKDPVVVERDIPGFIANRIQSAMAREAWALLEADVASPEDIDRAIKGTFGFRLPILGAFEKADHSGLDIHHTVLSELLPEIDRRTSPPEVLSSLIERERYGAKTGRGVYDWRDEDLDAVAEARDQRLVELLDVYRSAKRKPQPNH